jgi:3-methyladenine DNA glycosylase/8-oxoguanine DNA glycosylase
VSSPEVLSVTPTASVVLPVEGPLDLVRTCRALCDGGSDPTWDISIHRVTRAMRTPDGPATIEARWIPIGLRVQGWGPGSDWALARSDRMFGLHDRAEGFEPELHTLVHRMARQHPGLRFGASLRTWDALVPTVLGQRVTVGEARRSWRQLVRRYGSPAPGPPGHHGLLVPPSAADVAALGIADWHVLGVERSRAETVRRAIPVLRAIEQAAEYSSAEFQRVLTTVRGIGQWTASSLAAVVLGDPDAVLMGDLHLPHTVAFALAGEPRADDERMLELLEPWRGHRQRVVRLLKCSGVGAPRRGPRYTPLPINRW